MVASLLRSGLRGPGPPRPEAVGGGDPVSCATTSFPTSGWGAGILETMLVRMAFRRVDGFLVQSHGPGPAGAGRFVRRSPGAAGSTIPPIPSTGAGTPKRPGRGRSPASSFSGTSAPTRGLDILIEAFARVRRELEAELVVAGEFYSDPGPPEGTGSGPWASPARSPGPAATCRTGEVPALFPPRPRGGASLPERDPERDRSAGLPVRGSPSSPATWADSRRWCGTARPGSSFHPEIPNGWRVSW